MKTTEIPMNADHVDVEDLPREIAFAKACIDTDDPATVYWLAALFSRFEALEGDER